MSNIKYYYISITITYFLVIFGITIYFLFLKDIFPIPECGIYQYTGFYCPACGCTRAVMALKDFNFLESFKYNPIVLYTFVFSSLFIFIESINIIFKRDSKLPWKFIVYIGLIIFVINWIIQNIFIVCKKI